MFGQQRNSLDPRTNHSLTLNGIVRRIRRTPADEIDSTTMQEIFFYVPRLQHPRAVGLMKHLFNKNQQQFLREYGQHLANETNDLLDAKHLTFIEDAIEILLRRLTTESVRTMTMLMEGFCHQFLLIDDEEDVAIADSATQRIMATFNNIIMLCNAKAGSSTTQPEELDCITQIQSNIKNIYFIAMVIADERGTVEDYLSHTSLPINLNFKDPIGNTALHAACEVNGNIDMIDLLLGHHANPNQTNHEGEHSLISTASSFSHHIAAQQNGDGKNQTTELMVRIMELLIAHGANPNHQDTHGHTCFDHMQGLPEDAIGRIMLRLNSQTLDSTEDDDEDDDEEETTAEATVPETGAQIAARAAAEAAMALARPGPLTTATNSPSKPQEITRKRSDEGEENQAQANLSSGGSHSLFAADAEAEAQPSPSKSRRQNPSNT